MAGEIAPGALDLTIAGFARFEAFGGQLDDARQDARYARGLDFRNDTEVHVLARAVSEDHGFEYGATIELEADTSQRFNAKETWIFLRGDWGELRVGDVEGVAEESAVGAQEIAAGTGGIDGDVVDEIAVPVVLLTNSDASTKIRYYSLDWAGFTFAASYAPTQEEIDGSRRNGRFIARKAGSAAMQAQNLIEAGLIYDGELGDLDALASLVALSGTLRNGGEREFGRGRWQGWQAGASLALFGLTVAGSYGSEEMGDFGRSFMTAGAGWGDEAWNVSVTYGRVIDVDQSPYGHPSNLVLSADYQLMPGLTLAADLGRFDNDGRDPDYKGGDRGWQAVAQLGVAF